MSSVATPTNIAADPPASQPTIQTLNIRKEVLIQAPIDIAWESLLEEMGPESEMPDGTKFPRVLEAFPGGRWYRDTGKDTGHLWGHVQVIKPPKVLELVGPTMMSYPAISHIQYRLVEQADGTLLKFTHQAIGLIEASLQQEVSKGWDEMLSHIRTAAEKKRG